MFQDFWPLFWRKKSLPDPNEQAKPVLRTFSISRRNSHKLRDPRSYWLYGHDVGVVVDYTDMVVALSLTSRIRCQCSRWLCGHGVGVVNDCADTDKTPRTLSKIFEGFSQILKEQSGKNRYLGLSVSTEKFELCDRISSRKRKSAQNRFRLYICQGQIFQAKNAQTSHDTIPLSFAHF